MKILILDRDGVINVDSKDYVKSQDEWLPIESSIKAMQKAKRHGYRLYIATNQSGIARKYYSRETLASMHQKMHRLLGFELDGIFFCPHGPNDGCLCRKPNTGLLQQIAEISGHSLRDTPFIGDSLRDLQCAQDFGCEPILVRTGNGIKTENLLDSHPKLQHTPTYDSLAHYIETLITSTH